MAWTKKQINFGYLGANQLYFVPADCGDTLSVTLFGAGGAFAQDGAGGMVSGDWPIQESWRGKAAFVFQVGGKGGTTSTNTGAAGGWPDGGDGGSATAGPADSGGYGGSGSTRIYFDGSAAPATSLANCRMIAAGAGSTGRVGGGTTLGHGGAGGDTVGVNGTDGVGGSSSQGGRGGTQVAGGAGGAPGGTANGYGQNGSSLQGGNGGSTGAATPPAGGGGGGGGYYGGGGGGSVGGGASGGGGGGSNYLEFTYLPSGGLSGQGLGAAPVTNGSASIAYVPTPQAPVVLLPSSIYPEAIITQPLSNLAINPNMESGTSFAWTNAANLTSVTASGTKKYKGSFAGRISWKQNTAASAGRAQLTLTGMAIGQRYGISLRVLGDNVAGNPRVGLHMLGHAGAAEEGIRTYQTVRDGVTWETITCIFTAKYATENLQIFNRDAVPNTASSTRFTYFDTLMIETMTSTQEFIDPYFDGSDAGASWAGAVDNSISTKVAVLNPDYPIRLNWRYIADTTNSAPHWKSRLRWSKYNPGTATWSDPSDFPFSFGVVANKTANNGALLQASVPVENLVFLGDGGRYRFVIQDMNQATEMYGLPAYLEFVTPVRPAGAVWIDPAKIDNTPGNPADLDYVYKSFSDVPMEVTWSHADAQVKWKVDIYNFADIQKATSVVPLWSSGWVWEPQRPGQAFTARLFPSRYIRGMKVVLYVTTHNGTIASYPSGTFAYLTPTPNRIESKGRAPGLELEVYDGFTGEFIDVIPNRMAPTFLDELRGNCAGSFTIRLNDPSYIRSPKLIKPRNIVRVKDRGEYIGFWVITGHTPTVVHDEESSGEVMIIRGMGGYGLWFSDALVFPPRGIQDFGSQDSLVPAVRSFGAASLTTEGNWYDITSWASAVAMCRQDNAVAAASGGNPWRTGPSDWPADLASAYWMWNSDVRINANPGVVVFKSGINNAGTTSIPIQFYIAADNAAEVFFDGDPWVSVNDWQSTTQSDVRYMGPGYHEITIIASQTPTPGAADYTNPAGVLCGLYTLNPASVDIPHGVTLKSGTSWICTGYRTLPSWTVGDILQQLYGEALGRGVTSFSNFQLGFDDIHDSYGLPWAHDGSQWEFDVFSDYAAVVDKLTDTACEIWFDKNMLLQASRRRGVDRAKINIETSYHDIIVDAGPDYLWDFNEGPVSVSIPSAPLTNVGLGTVTGNGVAFSGTNGGASYSDNGWITKQLGPGQGYLSTPADNQTGLTYDPNYMSFYNHLSLYYFTSDFLTNPVADVAFPLSGPDGMTLEFIGSNNYFQLTFNIYPPESLVNFPTVPPTPYVLSISCQDTSATVFDSMQVTIFDTARDVYIQTYLRQDDLSHHWAVNFFNSGPDAFLVLYRDGVEILATPLAIGIVAGSFTMSTQTDLGTHKQKYYPGWGEMAIYGRILTEEEIVTHFYAMQQLNYGNAENVIGYGGVERIEPVIFRKAKNVLQAEATIDYSAKTALITRTSSGAAQVNATRDAQDKFGRIEGYYDGSSKEPSEARRTASNALSATLLAQTSNTLEVVSDYIPWVDFGVGDWVLAPGDYGEELVRRRIMSISVTDDGETGRSLYTIEIDSRNNQEGQRLALWLTRTLPQGNLSGLISNSG